MKEIPMAWIPADVPESICRAYGLADNQIPTLGEWDLAQLDVTLDELKLTFDLADLGFDPMALDMLFAS